MRKAFITLACMGAGLCALADGLDYTLGQIGSEYVGENKKVTLLSPLTGAGFDFKGAIALTGNGGAEVTAHDGAQVVALSETEVYKTDLGSNIYSSLILRCEAALLPVGGEYELIIKEGTVALEGDPTVTNPEIRVAIYVPEHIGDNYISYTRPHYSSSDKKYMTGISVEFNTTIAPLGSPKWKLYKDEEMIGEYDALVGSSGEIGRGMCSADFGAPIYPAASATYTLVLPEGSFSNSLRSDITNSDIRIVLYKPQSAIDELEAEASAAGAKFYDLNGRVLKSRPQSGPYIKVSGGKAEKCL